MLIADLKPYKCQLCDFTCSCFSEYGMHLTGVHAFKGPPFHCDICHHSARSLLKLMDHRIFHFDVRPYKCDSCCFQTKTKYALRYHALCHYSSKGPYKCPYCKTKCSTLLTLKRHLPRHKKEDTFVCHQCDYASNHKRSLSKHRNVHPQSDTTINLPNRKEKKQTLKTTRTRRQAIHVEDALYDCAICDKYFACKSAFKSHKCIHYPKIFFKCAMCDYNCALARSMRNHFRKCHSGTHFVPIQREIADCDDFISGELYHIVRMRPSSKDSTATIAKSQSALKILQQLSDRRNPDLSTSVLTQDKDQENTFRDGLVESSGADVVTSIDVESQQVAAENGLPSVNDIKPSDVEGMCNFPFSIETSQSCIDADKLSYGKENDRQHNVPNSFIAVNSPHLFMDRNDESNQSEIIPLISSSFSESSEEPSQHRSAMDDDELDACTNGKEQYQSTASSCSSIFQHPTESSHPLQYQVPQPTVGGYVAHPLIENSCDPQFGGYFEISNNIQQCNPTNLYQDHLENSLNILKQNQEKENNELDEQQSLLERSFLFASNPNAYQTIFQDDTKHNIFIEYSPVAEPNSQPLNDGSHVQQVLFDNTSQSVFQGYLESNANALQYSQKEKSVFVQPQQYIRLEANVDGNNNIPDLLFQNSSVPLETPWYLETMPTPHFVTGNNPPVLQERPLSLNTISCPIPILINQPNVLHSPSAFANINVGVHRGDAIRYKSIKKRSLNKQSVSFKYNDSVEIIHQISTQINNINPKQNVETQTDFVMDDEHCLN